MMKATKDELKRLQGRLETLEGQMAQKGDLSDVRTLEESINQQKNVLSAKASQEGVVLIGMRLSQAEQDISLTCYRQPCSQRVFKDNHGRNI